MKLRQSISFEGLHESDYDFKHNSALGEDEVLTLEVDGEEVLCLDKENVLALAKFLNAIID